MTALADSGDRAKRSSGYALRPPASLTLICLLIALAGAALVALTVGAAGIPLARLPAALGLWGDAAAGPMLARDQLVLWSIRIPRIAAAGAFRTGIRERRHCRQLAVSAAGLNFSACGASAG